MVCTRDYSLAINFIGHASRNPIVALCAPLAVVGRVYSRVVFVAATFSVAFPARRRWRVVGCNVTLPGIDATPFSPHNQGP
jgi:hypothetical protein